MAKGDKKKVETQNADQGRIMQDSQNQMMNQLYGMNQGFQNNYNQGSGMNMGSYSDIMGKYNSLYDNPFGADFGSDGSGGGGGGGFSGYGLQRNIYGDLAQNGGGYGWDPGMRGAVDDAISGFRGFADNGGFSDQNIQDIRARSIAPIRGIYSNAQSELNRSRALGGGSPNYAAALARMSRQQGQSAADASTNAEAGIAQMVQQGKLAGLQGLSSTGLGGQGLSTDIDELNAQMKLAGLTGLTGLDDREAASRASASASADANARALFQAKMGVLGGMQDMYGATPGMMELTGDQLLKSGDQLLEGQGYQNQLGGMRMNGAMNASQVPGNFSQAMGNIGSGLQLGGQIASPFLGAFGGGNNSSNNPYGVAGGGFGGGLYGGDNVGGGASKPSGWAKAGKIAGSVLPWLSLLSDRNAKEDITPLDPKRVSKGLKNLDLYTWKYKGDDTKHMGPMAQDFKKQFGVGDGRTIHLADVMGVMIASAKAGQ